ALYTLWRPGPDGKRPVARLVTTVLVAPLGWFAWFGWVGYRAGSWDGYFEVQERWGTTFDGGSFTVHRIADVFLKSPVSLNAVVVSLTICLAAGLLVICLLQRQHAALLVYTAFLLLLTVSGAGYFHSKARFLIPAFPLLFPLARVIARARPALIWTLLGGLTLVSSAYGGYLLLVWTRSP
ncbi:hypothetical protein PUR26_00550, partial [Streptomyces sp. SP18CS02]|nr:hypothetical protein [Streptomyces sp. SP18CS02]